MLRDNQSVLLARDISTTLSPSPMIMSDWMSEADESINPYSAVSGPGMERTVEADVLGLKFINCHIKEAYRSLGLKLVLHDHDESRVYNSGSSISGEVVIKPSTSIRYMSIQIQLTGHARVLSGDGTVTSRVTHKFLELDMPLPPGQLDTPGTLQAGKTERIPFHFVVPYQLPSRSCLHEVDSDRLLDYHLRLPPSTGGWKKTDMSPDNVEIQYHVRAVVTKSHQKWPIDTPTMEAKRLVRVVPSSVEVGGSSFDTVDDDIRRSIDDQSSRRGSSVSQRNDITATLSPVSMHLGRDDRESQATMRVGLFCHAQGAPPAELVRKITAKIRCYTWYDQKPHSDFPVVGDSGQVFTISTPLEETTPPPQEWSRHRNSRPPEDGASAGSQPALDLYTSSIEIPFCLPTSKKTFLPTFHSCLVSRTYRLEATVHFRSSIVKCGAPLRILGPDLAEPGLLPSYSHISGQQSGST